MRRRDHGRARARQGFTLIEVMISLGVMTIGAMGVIALQQHTIRSNSHARQLSIGMQIAQTWIERLKQDAHTWLGTDNPTVDLAGTSYLREINTAAPNVFITIPNAAGFQWDPDGDGVDVIANSRAFDYRGLDLELTGAAPVGDPIFYCVAFRPAWVYFGRAMRVDVRVWWPRREFDQFSTFGECNNDHFRLDPGAANTLFNADAFHVVYLSTVIRVTQVLR